MMHADAVSWGPVLSGERVRLQPIDQRLARAMVAGTPESDLAWEEGFPMKPVLAIARVIADAPEPLGPFLAYVIIRRSDGLAVGDAGFHGPPSPTGEIEVGYALTPAARGAGLVHEAVHLLTSWAWSQSEVRSIIARVEPGNAPSERVLVRGGFALEGEVAGMLRYVLEPPQPEGD
jgi:RimJ/RimL family protein N-acetyltransferase